MALAKDPLTHIDILTHIIILRLKSPVCLATQKGISEMPRSLVLCGELKLIHHRRDCLAVFRHVSARLIFFHVIW